MKSQNGMTKKVSRRRSRTRILSYILAGALAAATVLSGCATSSSGNQTKPDGQKEQTQAAAEIDSTADSSNTAASGAGSTADSSNKAAAEADSTADNRDQAASGTDSTADSSNQSAAEEKTADSSRASAIGSNQMVIRDGMAQQIVHYTNAQDPAYTNEGSEILRFVVYVETDHDTDLDGKPDLIKTVVQLPRPAAEGAYKAPVIYEARPYNAGNIRLPPRSGRSQSTCF